MTAGVHSQVVIVGKLVPVAQGKGSVTTFESGGEEGDYAGSIQGIAITELV